MLWYNWMSEQSECKKHKLLTGGHDLIHRAGCTGKERLLMHVPSHVAP